MAGHEQDIILAAGKSWRAGNGGVMRRRFQAGGVRKRGTRSPVWEGRYYEPVLIAGTAKSAAGSGLGFVLRDHQNRSEAQVSRDTSPSQRRSSLTGAGNEVC